MLDKEGADFLVFVDVQRSFLVFILRVDVGTMLDKEGADFLVFVDVQRSISVCVFRVDIGAMLEKKSTHFLVFVDVQRSISVCVLRVDVGAMLDKEGANFPVVVDVQRSTSIWVRSSSSEKSFEQIFVVVANRIPQCWTAKMIAGVDVEPFVEKLDDLIHITKAGGCPDVKVGPSLEKERRDGDVNLPPD
ncbi:hypothetical protein GGTG_06364 [Gaeumannomyces tritici R3-111a-1]|uniref:Uncharacterized protein n=1 Tax=Gaeumannomyces tritici (strain R3-111a-1) TaxID=644352 RepID=J3NYL2_GAET3|nr:hypothetical protein GGTG_06364 [Gaeumannomyces tritici R3-111a-1]EJT76445.1 hypothetical protein GGTG_06364 [Gaeumannomyces tritici R3-111a-1]